MPEPIVNTDETVDESTQVEEVQETEPTVEELKAQIAELQAAKQKANDEAGKYRKRAKEAQATVTNPDDEISKATAEVENKWKTNFVRQAATLAFTKEGVEPTSRLMKLLDLSEIEVDDEGNVEGLEDQITEIKKDFPQLFPEVKKTKAPPKTDGAAKGTQIVSDAEERALIKNLFSS